MDREKLLVLMAGALTGVFSGLTGVGGGVFLVSTLVSFLGFTQHRAHGTSLAVIIFLALFGAATYAFQGYYDLELTLILGVASAVGVIAGARLMAAVSQVQLRRAFGLFLFLVSTTMLLKGIDLPGSAGILPAGVGETPVPIGLPFWVILGLIAGVLGGFMGIGGAMIIVPAMVLVAGFEQHMAQGISLAVITLTSLMGAFTHYKLGNVNVDVALRMAPAAIVTVILGSAAAGQLDGFWLTKIFGVAMLYFAFLFTFKGGRRPLPQSPRSALRTSE